MTPRKASGLSRWCGIIIGVTPPVEQAELRRLRGASAPQPSRPRVRGSCILAALVHVAHEHGDPQPSARRLARQEDLLPLWQIPPLAGVLGMGVGEETRPQEDGVLAILLAQRVDTLVGARSKFPANM